MTYFIRNGNSFMVSDEESIDITNNLPVGNYVVKHNPISKEFFIERISTFTNKGKIYGDTMVNASRIMTTFINREVSTGILLTGEKGSGKTLLARTLSIQGNDLGYPTIIINTPWVGDDFNKFIQSIEQPCIILFDEFEKIYNPEEQEKLLTLLDGVYLGKKLFILTCNDKYRIDKQMRNRPGRIFYMIDFTGLSEEFIREYCNDILENTSYTNEICGISSIYSEFNFDMLKALCEEMNRYGETPEQSMKILNAKPEHGESAKFTKTIFINDIKLSSDKISGITWNGNPLAQPVYAEFMINGSEDNDINNWETMAFSVSDIVNLDVKNQTFTFQRDNVKLLLEREKSKKFDMFRMF